MAELSYVWDGTSGGDATLAPYDSSEFAEICAALSGTLGIPTYLSGVLRAVDNTFNVAFAANQATIDTGRAFVNGRYYKNTAPVNIASPNAGAGQTRDDLITLRTIVANKQTRLTRVAGTSGGAAAAPTNDAATWDEPLYMIRTTDAGVVSLVSDLRSYAPRHGNQSAEGAAASHAYAQIAGAPVASASAGVAVTPISVGAIGADTGHYALPDHTHGLDALEYGVLAAGAVVNSGVPGLIGLSMAVISGAYYLLKARFAVQAVLGDNSIGFGFSGVTIVGPTTMCVISPPDASGDGLIAGMYANILDGKTYVIDYEAIVQTTINIINVSASIGDTTAGRQVNVLAGSYIAALV